jgi:hypothetical protein
MTTKNKGIVIVLDTFDTEPEATKAMFRYARNLRRLRQTARYGVFVEQRKGAWWLCLVDRRTP